MGRCTSSSVNGFRTGASCNARTKAGPTSRTSGSRSDTGPISRPSARTRRALAGSRLHVGDERDEGDLVLEVQIRSLFAPLALETREPSAVFVIRDEDELGAGAVASERNGGSQRHDRVLDADRHVHARETGLPTPRFELSGWREATEVKLARRWPVAVDEEARLVCRRQALYDETSTSVED